MDALAAELRRAIEQRQRALSSRIGHLRGTLPGDRFALAHVLDLFAFFPSLDCSSGGYGAGTRAAIWLAVPATMSDWMAGRGSPRVPWWWSWCASVKRSGPAQPQSWIQQRAARRRPKAASS